MIFKGVRKKLSQELFFQKNGVRYPYGRVVLNTFLLGVKCLAGLFLTCLLAPLSLVIPVEIWLMKLGPDKASHFIDGIEQHLRRNQFEGSGRKSICIVIWPQRFPNKTLAKMYRRAVFIVGPRQKFLAKVLPFVVWKKNIRNHEVNKGSLGKLNRASRGEISVSFSKDHLELGHELNSKLFGGLQKQIIVFGYTSPKYRAEIDQMWHPSENLVSEIPSPHSFIPLIKRLNQQGYVVVRQGLNLDHDLSLESAGLIVPELDCGSGFADVWLAARSDLVITAHTGGYFFAEVFNKPFVITDVTTTAFPSYSSRGTIIFALCWLIRENRFATFEWMKENPRWCFDREKVNREYQIVHNSPQQIIDVVDEKLSRISGSFVETEEDQELQRRFHKFVFGVNESLPILPRAGTKFLREYQHLLPD